MKSTKIDKRTKQQRVKAKKKLTKMAKKGKLRRNVRDKIGEVQRQKMRQKEKGMEQIRRDWLFDRKMREREQSLSSDFDEENEKQLQMEYQRTKRKSRKNRKKNEQSDEKMKNDDEDMEEQMRSFVGREEELLPVKVAGKLVKRVKIREKEEEEETKPDMDIQQQCQQMQDDKLGTDEKERMDLADKCQMTAAENEAILAALAGAIVAEPQQNVSKFRLLLRMASGDDDLSQSVREHSQKLAVASLTELFVNVLPGYEIRPLTDSQKAQKMKKETKW